MGDSPSMTLGSPLVSPDLAGYQVKVALLKRSGPPAIWPEDRIIFSGRTTSGRPRGALPA
jgi:hypothetical protein